MQKNSGAHIQLCDEGRSAFLVLADGTTSSTFNTKEEGHEVINEFALSRAITSGTKGRLRKKLEALDLPEDEADFSRRVSAQILEGLFAIAADVGFEKAESGDENVVMH